MTVTQANQSLGAVFESGLLLIQQSMASAKNALSRRKAYRKTYAELSSLSDRDLRDLGIPRSDIGRLAREEAYGD